MTLKECVEVLQSSTGGGVFTAENLLEVGFAEQVLGIGRAICVKELYPKRNTVHEIYYQTVELNYEEDLQEDDCYTLFRYPVILNINSEIDGHQYLGKAKGDVSWIRVKSFAHYQNLKAAYGRIRNETLHYVLEPEAGLVRVFHNSSAARPKKAVGRSIFADPLHPLIMFNRQEDQYPITPECLALVEQYLREGKFQRYMQRMPNAVANGADDIVAAQGQPQQQ
jgi:hypothetical protein